MAIVVTDKPERSEVGRRMWRRLRGLAGGVLLLGAAAVAVLAVVLPIIWAFARFGHDENDGPRTEEETAFVATLGRACLVALLIAICGWATGKYLLRSRRGTALWLRRFRFGDATRVVSTALDYIGRTWRVVTLDDAATEAVGVAAPLRITNRVLSSIGQALPKIRGFVIVMWKVVAWTSGVALAAVVAWSAYNGRLGDVAESVLGDGSPSDSTESALVLVLGAVFVANIALLLAALALMLAGLPLLGLSRLAHNVQDDLTAAEAAKSRTIRNLADIELATSAIASVGQELLAPRLTVLKVDSAVWKETVTAVAEISGVVIIDVSLVTENLLWEVDESTRLFGTRIVYVAEREHVERLVGDAPPDIEPTAAAERDRLRAFLDGRRILAYTQTFMGRLRFQRALFGELEATRPHTGMQPTAVRRAAFALAGVVGFAFGISAAISMLTNQL